MNDGAHGGGDDAMQLYSRARVKLMSESFHTIRPMENRGRRCFVEDGCYF